MWDTEALRGAWSTLPIKVIYLNDDHWLRVDSRGLCEALLILIVNSEYRLLRTVQGLRDVLDNSAGVPSLAIREHGSTMLTDGLKRSARCQSGKHWCL